MLQLRQVFLGAQRNWTTVRKSNLPYIWPLRSLSRRKIHLCRFLLLQRYIYKSLNGFNYFCYYSVSLFYRDDVRRMIGADMCSANNQLAVLRRCVVRLLCSSSSSRLINCTDRRGGRRIHNEMKSTVIGPKNRYTAPLRVRLGNISNTQLYCSSAWRNCSRMDVWPSYRPCTSAALLLTVFCTNIQSWACLRVSLLPINSAALLHARKKPTRWAAFGAGTY